MVIKECYVYELRYSTNPDLVIGNLNQLIRFTFTGTGTVLVSPSNQIYFTKSEFLLCLKNLILLDECDSFTLKNLLQDDKN
jgi:hypothetical protein